jgi:hypothetical protein
VVVSAPSAPLSMLVLFGGFRCLHECDYGRKLQLCFVSSIVVYSALVVLMSQSNRLVSIIERYLLVRNVVPTLTSNERKVYPSMVDAKQ